MKLLIAIAALILALPESGLRAPQNEAPQSSTAQQESKPSGDQQPQKPATSQSEPASQPAAAQPPEKSPSTIKPSASNFKSRKNRSRSHSVGSAKPDKVIVRNGGARESTPQISPAMSKDQQLRQRENTTELLATTDANLKRIEARQLTTAQQSMMGQIRTYMQQSKAASEAGDLERANTLATKAHLLSDDLLHR